MVLIASVCFAQEPIQITEGLGLAPVAQARRVPLHVDPVELSIVRGEWRGANEGDEVVGPDGESVVWEALEANEKGRFTGHGSLRGGYVLASVNSEADRVMILFARSHSLVYVNGEPFAGDPYNTGRVRVPVLLKKGENEFLFRCGRGSLWAQLVEPAGAVSIELFDTTFPDLLRGREGPWWGAVVVVNATDEAIEDAVMVARSQTGERVETAVGPIGPMTARKVGLELKTELVEGDEKIGFEVELVDGESGEALCASGFELAVREQSAKHRVTFVSEIDGSVQYYSVTPAHGEAEGPLGLVLTLHGAGVEAQGQAAAYGHKDWAHIVAPTNRRHFGFDWEDWGRLDAIEVLEHASDALGTDPLRTYLTGHSMGGHGTWQIGVQFPDRFAAIAPSAGWVSFWSYTGAVAFENATPVEQMLIRAASPSDTLGLSVNYKTEGIYILHGDRDDNVPVEQARTMRAHLSEYHTNFAYYEQPGAGHWWGNRCVDWPPLFDFLGHQQRMDAAEVGRVEFATANPGVTASSEWVEIEQQVRPLEVSHVSIDRNVAERRFTGTTENVARLGLEVVGIEEGGVCTVELDGQLVGDIAWPGEGGRIWVEKRDGQWAAGDALDLAQKGPHRSGPFRDAFRNRMMFVYGTGGSDQERAWAYAKARYDAQTFWYRGNGSVDVIADVDFDPGLEPDRNVIVYGNASTNRAWDSLLGGSPVQVDRGEVVVGGRQVGGEDLACLFVRPRPGSDTASVGVVSGSGLAGMKLTDRLPYFVSGIHYPDWIVLGPETLMETSVGVRGAGFFGNDWLVSAEDSAWSESRP